MLICLKETKIKKKERKKKDLLNNIEACYVIL